MIIVTATFLGSQFQIPTALFFTVALTMIAVSTWLLHSEFKIFLRNALSTATFTQLSNHRVKLATVSIMLFAVIPLTASYIFANPKIYLVPTSCALLLTSLSFIKHRFFGPKI